MLLSQHFEDFSGERKPELCCGFRLKMLGNLRESQAENSRKLLIKINGIQNGNILRFGRSLDSCRKKISAGFLKKQIQFCGSEKDYSAQNIKIYLLLQSCIGLICLSLWFLRILAGSPVITLNKHHSRISKSKSTVQGPEPFPSSYKTFLYIFFIPSLLFF